MDLQNKTAIVTGGSKGIGRGIAEALVGEGINVVISARSRNEIDEAVLKLNALRSGSATGIVADVCNYAQVQALFERAVAVFGGVDILINNAGIGIFGPVEEMAVEDFRTSLTFLRWLELTPTQKWPRTMHPSLA